MRLQGLEPWTNRLRVYCSTNWAKGAYFCFSVFHWMIHSLNTNKIIKDSAEKSNLFFTVSLLLLKTAKTGLIILLNFTIFSTTAPMAAEPTSVSYLSFSKASPAPEWISGFYKDSRCRHIYSDSRNPGVSAEGNLIFWSNFFSAFRRTGHGHRKSSFSSILYRECQHWPENSLF